MALPKRVEHLVHELVALENLVELPKHWVEQRLRIGDVGAEEEGVREAPLASAFTDHLHVSITRAQPCRSKIAQSGTFRRPGPVQNGPQRSDFCTGM